MGRQRLGLKRVMEVTLTATTSYISSLVGARMLAALLLLLWGEIFMDVYVNHTKPFNFPHSRQTSLQSQGDIISEEQEAGNWDKL